LLAQLAGPSLRQTNLAFAEKTERRSE